MSLPLKHPKIVAALVALVGVSGLAGLLLGRELARHEIDSRNNPANWNEYVVEEFDRLIQPTAEQRPKVLARLDHAVQELQSIRLETFTKTTNVIWRLVAEVEQELTPEQRASFEALKPKPAELNLELLNVSPLPGLKR